MKIPIGTLYSMRRAERAEDENSQSSCILSGLVLHEFSSVGDQQYTVGKPTSWRRRSDGEREREGEKTPARFSYSILVVTARIKNQRAKAHNPRDRAERAPLVQRNTSAKTAPAELPGVPRTSTRKNALKNWPKQPGGPVAALPFHNSDI